MKSVTNDGVDPLSPAELWSIFAVVVFAALFVSWLIIGMLSGLVDGNLAGENYIYRHPSYGSMIVHAAPTYALCYWLSEPR